jgi:hypothetical protein
MRKLLALATLVGTALVIGVSPASTAKIDDLHGGPVCADILNDSGIFDYDPAAGTVTFALRTAAPSCRGVLYTVNVYSDTGAHAFLGFGHTTGTKTADAQANDGTGITFVTATIPSMAEAPNSFCISATSSGDRVFDFAPDSGCISFVTPQRNLGPGQTGFN